MITTEQSDRIRLMGDSASKGRDARSPAGRGNRAKREGPRRGNALAAPLGAAFAALLLFAPSMDHRFIRDDHELIERNAALHGSVGAVAGALVSDFHAAGGGRSGKWRPWITLSYAIDGHLGGWQPRMFHTMNVVAHALVVAVLCALLLQTGIPPPFAFGGALWFAAMPVHVETVSWISGRTDLYAALFMLAALVWDRRDRRSGRTWPSAVPLVLFGIGLLCKESSIAFLAVLATAVWIEPGKRGGRVRWLAPYAGLAVVYAALWMAVGHVPARPSWYDAPTVSALRWGTAGMLPAYLRFLLPGVTHAPDWPLPSATGPLDPRVLVGLTFSVALFGVLAIALSRRSRWAVPLALLTAPLLPAWVAGIALAAGGAVMAERLVYLASAGAAWMLALGASAGAAWLTRRRWPAGAIVGVGLAGLVAWSAWTTWSDQSMYRTDESVYAAIRERVPTNPVGALGLAGVRLTQDRVGDAVRLIDEAEALNPRIPEIHQSRAEIAFAEARWADAARAADRTVELVPWRGYPRMLRDASRVRLGQGAVVASELESLYVRSPGDPLVQAALGEWRLAEGRPADAAPLLERSLRAQPEDPFTALALARAWHALGRDDDAAAALDHTLRLAPRFYEAWLLEAEVANARGAPAARDSALVRARVLPESRDGRAAALAARLSRGTP
jgi:protein O-mannosyl-transferase